MGSKNRYNPALAIEYKFNLGPTIEECTNCGDEFTAANGFIPFEKGTEEVICPECSESGQLPPDFHILAEFFDKWGKEEENLFVSWYFKDDYFNAVNINGCPMPFPAGFLRQIAGFDTPVDSAIEVEPKEKTKSRTSQEILDQTNELARQFYAMHDRGGHFETGFRFDLSEHPQERQCWEMACKAQLILTQTDLEDVLSDLE